MDSLIDRIKQLSCNLPWSEMSEEQKRNEIKANMLFIIMLELEAEAINDRDSAAH